MYEYLQITKAPTKTATPSLEVCRWQIAGDASSPDTTRLFFFFHPPVRNMQQSFTLPIEPTNSAGEERRQPAGAQGTSGSGALGTEQEGTREAGVRVVAGDDGRVSTAEEAQQAFLSRLLLMLGSFVVLCLVLF